MKLGSAFLVLLQVSSTASELTVLAVYIATTLFVEHVLRARALRQSIS
jgi:hypothetical protein